MRLAVFWGVILSVVCLQDVAAAYPNFLGVTGIAGVPTALVEPRGDFTGAADVVFFSDVTFNDRLTFGVRDNLEFGAVLVSGQEEGLGFSAKYRLPFSQSRLGWAVGGTLITASDSMDGWQVFAAGSLSTGQSGLSGSRLIGTAGANYTDIDGTTAFRPFVGLQVFRGARTEFAVEYLVDADAPFDEAIATLVLRQRFGTGFSGEIGLTNATGFTGTDEHRVFLGAAYAFGDVW